MSQISSIYMVDAIFIARHPIRSLPPFHAARWSAWLRYACREYGVPLNDIVCGILPLRNGQRPIETDDIVCLRLLVGTDGLAHLAGLARSILKMPARGEFSPASFGLLFWRDAVGRQNHAPDAPPEKPLPLAPAAVADEIAALSGLSSWSLHLYVPLRLKLPAGEKGGGKGVMSFCAPQFFGSPLAPPHLCNKIRFAGESLEIAENNCLWRIKAHNLVWHDMRYNEARQIALGGVLGEMSCAGPIDRQTATLLVLGQYLGAGKNPLFGLGYWRIPELDDARKIPLEIC